MRICIDASPAVHHRGGFGRHVQELAPGLPVITTPNSGSVVRDGKEGFIIPIRDVYALRERMVYLYENAGVRPQMGGAARARAEQYAWDRSRQRLLKANERAVAERCQKASK